MKDMFLMKFHETLESVIDELDRVSRGKPLDINHESFKEAVELLWEYEAWCDAVERTKPKLREGYVPKSWIKFFKRGI